VEAKAEEIKPGRVNLQWGSEDAPRKEEQRKRDAREIAKAGRCLSVIKRTLAKSEILRKEETEDRCIALARRLRSRQICWG
jgi:hypothetical protein